MPFACLARLTARVCASRVSATATASKRIGPDTALPSRRKLICKNRLGAFVEQRSATSAPSTSNSAHLGETIRDSAANRAAPSSNASSSFSHRQLINSPSPLHRCVAIVVGSAS